MGAVIFSKTKIDIDVAPNYIHHAQRRHESMYDIFLSSTVHLQLTKGTLQDKKIQYQSYNLVARPDLNIRVGGCWD